MDYFRHNRWQIRGRSQINNPDNKDLETWSLKTLKDSIQATFEASIKNEEVLVETPNSEIITLLSQNPVNRKYQPSLYDLLSRRLLDYYSESSFFTSEFSDSQFGFPKEQLFNPGVEFYNTTIKVGNEKIQTEKLAETKKEAASGYLKINWNAEEVNESLGDIQIENNNSTAGYGGAYWQYFEELDKIEDHSESPLNIEKELYLNKPDNKLEKVTKNKPIKTGDLVTVRLVLRTTAAMDFIHLKDMRASGFEPTDVLSEYKYQDGTAYYQSTRDAATHFFFDSIRKGTYVLEYTLRANNQGDFSNGITLIESMYAPEFSGHTKGIRVQIRD